MEGDARGGPERLAVLLVGEDPLARAGLAALLAEERVGSTATLRLLRAGEVAERPITIGVR